MFDVPADAMYVWLGVATVSLAAFGVAVGLPGAAPPDATAAARAVDAVAVGPPGSTGTHDLTADRLRLGPARIGLAGPGGRAHATFAYGRVAPALPHGALERVVAGESPRSAFDSPASFETAVLAAKVTPPEWRPAPDRLRIRRVSWGDVNVTLVG